MTRRHRIHMRAGAAAGVRGSNAGVFHYPEDRKRRVEEGAVRSYGSTDVHCKLQRGSERARDRPRDRAGALAAGAITQCPAYPGKRPCQKSLNTGRRSGKNMEYITAFVIGGLICAVVQILLDRTKLMPGRVMVLLVCTGALLDSAGFIGLFRNSPVPAQACRCSDSATYCGRG